MRHSARYPATTGPKLCKDRVGVPLCSASWPTKRLSPGSIIALNNSSATSSRYCCTRKIVSMLTSRNLSCLFLSALLLLFFLYTVASIVTWIVTCCGGSLVRVPFVECAVYFQKPKIQTKQSFCPTFWTWIVAPSCFLITPLYPSCNDVRMFVCMFPSPRSPHRAWSV